MRTIGKTLCFITCVLVLAGCGSKCLKAEKIDAMEIGRKQDMQTTLEVDQSCYEEVSTLLNKLDFADSKQVPEHAHAIYITMQNDVQSYYVCEDGRVYYQENGKAKHGYQEATDKVLAKKLIEFIDTRYSQANK